MLPNEADAADSLQRAHREHRHAIHRGDRDAARLLSHAIAALEGQDEAGFSVVAQRVHASRPELEFQHVLRTARDVAIGLALAHGREPHAGELEEGLVARLALEL